MKEQLAVREKEEEKEEEEEEEPRDVEARTETLSPPFCLGPGKPHQADIESVVEVRAEEAKEEEKAEEEAEEEEKGEEEEEVVSKEENIDEDVDRDKGATGRVKEATVGDLDGSLTFLNFTDSLSPAAMDGENGVAGVIKEAVVVIVGTPVVIVGHPGAA